MKRRNNDINKYIWSVFLITTMLYILVYAISGFVPFGQKTVATWDLNGQYLPFMAYFQRIIKKFDLSFYTQQIALGGGTIGLLAYYLLSPFNLLVAFFDIEKLPLAIMLIILLKHSGSAITMFLFLAERYVKEKEKLWAFVLIAIVYAFSGYAINMQFNLMWLDGMIILPIICIGMERLVKKEKRGVLIFSLWISLISNFYIGYMLWIFSAVYFLFLLIESKKYKEIRIWKEYILSICLAAGMGMFLVLPLIYQLSISKLSGESAIDKIFSKVALFKNVIIGVIILFVIGLVFRRRIVLIIQKVKTRGRELKRNYPIVLIVCNIILIILSGVLFWNFLNWGSDKGLFEKKIIYAPLKLFPGAFSESEIINGLPNIYVGSFVIILVIHYLSTQKKGRRKKALFLFMLGLMFASMLIRPLNYIWHGFAYPNGSPWRYSFIISFILITMSAEYISEYGKRKIDRNEIIYCLSSWILLGGWIGGALYKYTDLQSDFLSVKKVSAGFGFCILITILMICMRKYEKKIISYILLFVLLTEMCYNAVWSLNEMNYTEWNSYKKQVREIQTVVTEIKEYDSGIYRIESPDLEANSALLYDYNGVSHYSSVIPASTVQLFDTFGMKPEFMGDMETLYNSTVKSEDAGLLGIKYIFSEHVPEDKDFKLIFRSGKYGVYQNLSYHEIINMVLAERITGNLSDFKRLSQEQLETIVPIKYTENEIIFEIPEYKGEEKRLLLSIAYDKGWQGEMDGHKVEIQKAYDSLLSIDVPEGKHTVVLKYEVPYLKEGILISVAFLIIMILLQNHDRKNKTRCGGSKV